ncbi:MAG: hypothetical protein HQ547_04780 [Candidatus Omnitrophica bacterium]|nr:hypothetical protein [Candidatus Omnitrophota bacterium]
MREDAFWDLSPDEIAELFYRLAMMYGTAGSNSYKELRNDPADVVNAVIVDLIKTVDKETIPAFQLGSFGCTPLAERAYGLLLPPYYGVKPTSTIAVNTSEAIPGSMQTISVSDGMMPGVLHVVEPLVQNEQDRKNLIAAGCWQTPPFARDVYGRSHLVNLGPGRLLNLNGGSFRDILAVPRFKANVYRDKFGAVHHPQMVRYFGGGAPSFTFAMDRMGRAVQVPHPGQPLGSIRLGGLLNEAGMSRKFWNKDFLVAYPLGYIERNLPRFRFRGESTGALLQAMPVNAGRRLLQEFEFIITRMASFYVSNNLSAHEREVRRLGELVENFAGHLRRIHDAGFIHGYPHTNNFSLLDYKTYLFMTHDLDNAREKSGMSLDEAMLFQTNDIGVAFLSLILALGPANVEHYNNFARNRNLPTIQKRFFGGYFRDLAGEVDSRYQDHATLRNFLFGEPTQRPISWIDDSLVHVMRRILEPENLRPLAITQAQLQQAPPNPLQRRVNCEVGINELSRLMEGAMLFEIPVLSEESQIGTGHADNVAMIPIPQAVRELAKGDEAANYVPVVSPGGLYLVYRDSPLYRQIIQQEQQIEAWQQRAEAGAARKQLDDIGAQGPGLSGSAI